MASQCGRSWGAQNVCALYANLGKLATGWGDVCKVHKVYSQRVQCVAAKHHQQVPRQLQEGMERGIVVVSANKLSGTHTRRPHTPTAHTTHKALSDSGTGE